MLDYWPWIAIGAGLVALLLPRLVRVERGARERVHYERGFRAPSPGSDDPQAELRIGRPKHALDPSVVMQMLITLMVLGAALYVILSKQYGDAEQKWAYGAIGTLLGFWLKK